MSAASLSSASVDVVLQISNNSSFTSVSFLTICGVKNVELFNVVTWKFCRASF